MKKPYIECIREKSKKIFGNKYFIYDQEIDGFKSYIKIHCNDCDEDFEQLIEKFLEV